MAQTAMSSLFYLWPGLTTKGHAVKLVAPARFKDLLKEHSIDFVPFEGAPEDVSQCLNNAGYNFIKMLREHAQVDRSRDKNRKWSW
jgi:hypothetical protein